MMDDDGDGKDDTKRRTRNLSEKKRRDQFNMLINELSTMICTNSRKMDKSTVLKSTISFLKNHNEVAVRSRAHDVNEDWKPTFLSNEEFTYLILEALEGFVMVFSANGKIFYVSEGIMSLLGHNPVDIVNKSIFDLTFEEDRSNLYGLLNSAQTAGNHMDTSMEDDTIQFQCHLRRGTLDFRDEALYELIQFNGHFRTNLEEEDHNNTPGYQRELDSRLLFICTGRLYTQLIRDVSLVDPDRSEFTSRHSLEWKFLFLDHRAPPIIGYLPFEVLGTSGYDYYHFDDLEKVVTCHEELMQKGELTSCYYRFLTKGQQWIWLQSRFYITYHQWNSKPEFIVCTHRVISYADVRPVPKPSEAMDTGADDAPTGPQPSKEQPRDEAVAELSPAYVPEASDALGSYIPVSRAPSLKSTSASSTVGTVVAVSTAAGAAWQRASAVCYQGSDTNSASGESWSSQRTSREVRKSTSASSTMGTVVAVSTAPGAAWQRASAVCYQGSDTNSASGESWSSQRTSREVRKSTSASSTMGTVVAVSTAPGAAWQRASAVCYQGSDTNSASGESWSSQRTSREVRKSTSASSTMGTVVAVSTAPGAAWQRASAVCYQGSDTNSASGESWSSQRTSREVRKSTSVSSTMGTVVAVSTAPGAAWQRASAVCYQGSDTNSASGESWPSQRTSRERAPQASPLVAAEPQQGIGVQYLEPAPYFDAACPNVVGAPVILSPGHAHVQGQLQRKHEQLQQLIAQQQEELRQVKEQLLLARLGLLQPLISVQNPFMTAEEIAQGQRFPLPLAADGAARAPGYHQPPPPHEHQHPQLPQ